MDETYRLDFDPLDDEAWSDCLRQFDDANLYQTRAFGAHLPGGRRLNHVVLRKGDAPAAICQVRAMTTPLFPRGIVYVYWGPLWRRRDEPRCPEHLGRILEGIHQEYAINRGLLVRIVPNLLECDDGLLPLFAEAGFRYVPSEDAKRTFLLSLAPTPEELRAGFRSNWRNHLRRSERNDLHVAEGTGDDLFEEFHRLYDEMLRRKGFDDPQDIGRFRSIQRELTDEMKMRVLICRYAGEPVAGIVCTAIGDTAEYILGATNGAGMKQRASYLLQWRTLEWLKERGCRWYDLGGIDPEANPGVYDFKAGLGGDDVTHVGQFEACRSMLSSSVVRTGELLRKVLKRG